LGNVQAVHYVLNYLDFVDATIDEYSAEFDSITLESVEKRCIELSKKIDTILHRREYR